MPLCLTAMAGWALGEFVHVYANWAAFYFGEKKELWYQETESTGINLHQLKQCFQVPRIFLSDVRVHHHPIIGYMFWLQWREAPFSNASFVYLFLAALGLRCCVRIFSRGGERGPLFVAVWRLLIEAASPVAENWLHSPWASAIAVRGLSCPMACGISLDQRSNLCPLPWQVDS